MALSQSYTMPRPIAGPAFCREPPFEFILVAPQKGSFTITDTNGSLLLSIEKQSRTLRKRTFVRDSFGNLILTIRKKAMSARDTWYAFRGDDEDRLLFYTKKSGRSHAATPLNVFLADDDSSEPPNPDFVVSGNYSSSTLDIHAGTTLVAKIRPRSREVRGLLVTLMENVDYAVVSALIAIVNLMEAKGNGAKAILGGAAAALTVVSGVASILDAGTTVESLVDDDGQSLDDDDGETEDSSTSGAGRES